MRRLTWKTGSSLLILGISGCVYDGAAASHSNHYPRLRADTGGRLA